MVSRAIPPETKREVRQRCAFGCVFCGVPIYEYDHIPGWANVQRHNPAEIALLCPNHHSAKTKGLLSQSQVEAARANPFNARAHQTSPFWLPLEGKPEVVLGEQRFSSHGLSHSSFFAPVMINGVAPLSFDFSQKGLLLNLDAVDRQVNNVLQIRESEILLSTTVFDATLVANRLTIHAGENELAVEMVFNPPNRIVLTRYRAIAGGLAIEVVNNQIHFQGLPFTFTLAGDGQVIANIGVCHGAAPPGLSIGIGLG